MTPPSRPRGPVPGSVLDAALRVVLGLDEAADRADVLLWHGDPGVPAGEAARAVLVMAAENGVARVCRG